MKKIVCNTKFKLDPFGDGGSKRSVQIRDLMAENGISVEYDPFDLPKGMPKHKLLRLTFRSMRFIRKHHPKRQIGSLTDYVQLVKYYALRIPVVYDKYLNQDVVFLWENTSDRNLLYLMKATGRSIIGMPHNIESLVDSDSVDELGQEVNSLKQCDWVFAISKEETWLLRLMGVKASFFPYYPPKEVETHLLEICKRREGRKANERKRFLLLGSASNSPTLKGMQTLIDHAASEPLPFDLGIAGYETESLSVPQHAGITFYGTVKNEELDRILEETDAVLVYQPPTTGALTRVPEMLMAGIPIFVNFDAGRNFLGVKDVHLYDSFEGLFDALEHFVPYKADTLQKDVMAESRFVKTINDASE